MDRAESKADVAPASWIRSGGCKGPSVGLCRSSWPAVGGDREQVESRESRCSDLL